ncbi:MAG: RNA polymerase sigma factor [Fimbriimonas sp.]
MDYERLANRHKDAVYRQMLRMCGNRDDAEDVLAESLLRAYRAAGDLQTEEAFQAWLAQIGRRVCGRLRRREAARPLFAIADLGPGWEPAAQGPSPEELALDAETKRCVQGALDSLPPPYREVYQRRDIDGHTAEEVASELGLTIPAVKSRLHRARAMVRERIGSRLCD